MAFEVAFAQELQCQIFDIPFELDKWKIRKEKHSGVKASSGALNSLTGAALLSEVGNVTKAYQNIQN